MKNLKKGHQRRGLWPKTSLTDDPMRHFVWSFRSMQRAKVLLAESK